MAQAGSLSLIVVAKLAEATPVASAGAIIRNRRNHRRGVIGDDNIERDWCRAQPDIAGATVVYYPMECIATGQPRHSP
jgi:hypothetical protein